MNQKIFCIGLNKTGTSTLADALRILGLNVDEFSKELLEDVINRRDFSGIHKRINQHDAFQDWPWPLIYKELDEFYPESLFILSERRSPITWLESLKAHSLRTDPNNHCRKLAYGFNYPHEDEDYHIKFYINHNQEAKNHFKERSHKLLTMCIEKNDGWRKLCEFLDLAEPEAKFPHTYKGTNPEKSKFFIENKKRIAI